MRSIQRQAVPAARKDPDCKRLLAKLAARGVDVQNENTWVRLLLFLEVVGLSASQVNHAGRFVDPALEHGKSTKC